MRRASLFVALCALVTEGAPLWAQATRDSVVYHISAASRLEVRTGKAGILGFAGHEHTIRARAFYGEVVYFPADPAASRVEFQIAASGLEVLTPPDTEEVRKVTEAMRGEVLDVARYPYIMFASRRLTPTKDGFRIAAILSMHGQVRDVPVDVRVQIGPDTLRAAAIFSINQSDFGITPFRGGPGGTVRVADRVTFDVDVLAVRQPREDR